MYQGIQCYPEFLIYYERVAHEVDADTRLPTEHAHNTVAETDHARNTVAETDHARNTVAEADHAGVRDMNRGEDAGAEVVSSELELLERQLDDLKKRAVEQTDRRVMLLASQKRLKMRFQNAKDVFLELQSRSAKARWRCCGGDQGPDTQTPNRLHKYIQSENKKIDLQ